MRSLKRSLDLVGAALGLLFLSPLMAVIALAIRLSMGPPVLFHHRRPGYKERIFTLYKFRTMTDARDAEGGLLPDAERLTRVGRIVRSLSLDELPQLWNVLKGDLSLVGPRPLLIEYLERYSAEQRKRHEVKPGITGWAQVNGRNDIDWEEKFRLDAWYVENRSFWLDLKILCLTAWKVLRREGISQRGEATMEKFMGDDHREEEE